MIGTAKKTDYPDTGVRLHAGARRLPHQHRRLLDTGSLADTDSHCASHHRYYCRLPSLETQ